MSRKRNEQAVSEAEPAFFTITRLAARWGVCRHTITAAIRAGKLHAFRVGARVYRVREDEVIRYEQQQNLKVEVA